MHDRFWQVSDTMGMPISQKLWIKLRSRIKWGLNENLFIYQLKEENAEFPTQHSRKVITGSFVCLCWGLMSQSTIFQSCWDGATASWVINQYFRGVKCLAQGHNTAAVGFEPPTSRSRVRDSTTETPRSPTGSFDDLQHIVYAQIKIIILIHICCKIKQISKNNIKSVKQASIAH